MRTLIVSVLAAAVLSACSDSSLPDYTKLGSLRVLSVQVGANLTDSDSAEGGVVTLTPLLSWVDGAGATVSWTTEACRDPGVLYGKTPTCDGATDRVTGLAGGTGTSQVIGSAANAWTATIPAITVNVPNPFFNPGAPFFPLSPIDQFNGYAYLVIMDFTSSTGEKLKAFKRILVTTRSGTDRNKNPQLDDILAADVSLASYPTAEVVMKASFSGIQTSYPALKTDGTPTTLAEDPTVTWFYSDGEFQRFRTTNDFATNSWSPPAAKPAGRAVVFVAVVRDGRGGESHKVVAFP